MSSLGILLARRGVQGNQPKITIMDSCVGKYWFNGKTNTDADRDVVYDQSGHGNDLRLYNVNFGYIDSNNSSWQREGYYDGKLWFASANSQAGTAPYGVIKMQPLTSCTIIIKRDAIANYTDNGMWATYGVLLGSGQTLSQSRYLVEYKDSDGKMTANNNGFLSKRFISDSKVIWMNDTHYCGASLTGTSSEREHDGLFYLHKLRGDTPVNKCYVRVYCIYIFNRNLTPEEIEQVIHNEIDDTYVMPTIE